jgi:MoxR-like ATPase
VFIYLLVPYRNRIMRQILSNLIRQAATARIGTIRTGWIFDEVVEYEGIKRTFLRALNSDEPVHVLLVGPPGQAKTLFLKCILEKFGEKGILYCG